MMLTLVVFFLFFVFFAARFVRQSARPFVRTLATSTKDVQPPVQLFGLDGSYATALYTASVKSSTLSSTESALASLKTLLSNDKKLGEILSNPALSSQDKKVVVDTLSRASKAEQTVSNFLNVLAENNRLSLLPAIADKFETLSNASKGIVEATITSATALDTRTINRLQTAISKSSFVGSGKKLIVNNKVNPDILGGLVVEVGDRTVDLSVSAKIAKLNKLLSEDI